MVSGAVARSSSLRRIRATSIGSPAEALGNPKSKPSGGNGG